VIRGCSWLRKNCPAGSTASRLERAPRS